MKKLLIKYSVVIFSVFAGIAGLVYSFIVRSIIEGIDSSTIFFRNTYWAIILMVATILINYLREIFLAKYIESYNIDSRNKLFESKLYINENIDYTSILINDIATVETEYVKAKFDLITCVVMFICAWSNLMLYSYLHGIIILIFSLASVSVSMIMRKHARNFRRNISSEQAHYTHRVTDMFLGITIIRQFQAINHICLEHNKENENLERSKYLNRKFLAKMEAVSSIFSMSMFFVSFLLGAFFVIEGIYSMAIMMAAIQLVNNIVSPMFEAVSAINTINGSSEIVQKIRVHSALKKEKDGELINTIEDISLNNLTYVLDEFKLNNLTYTFLKSKKYAIVGKSGAGKTTLLNLISGQLNYSGSGIAINSKSIGDINKDSLKDNVSYMNQEVFVFNDTIKNNIQLYNECDSNEYLNSLKISGLEDMISSLDEKDDYMLYNNGDNISGGEKQRIALARVVLRKSNVILLDEAFSALDNITANSIINDILKTNQMVIMIVHKYSKDILSKFDGIIVMDKGCIIETGSFDYLMSYDSAFKKLYYYNEE